MRWAEIIPIVTLLVSACSAEPEPTIHRKELFKTPTPHALSVLPPTETQEFNPESALEQISRSQRSLELNYQYLNNGVPETVSLRMGATIVDLAGTEYGDYVLVITAGHLFSWQGRGKAVGPEVQNEELESVTLGETLTLKRSEFGLDYAYDEIGPAPRDHALLLIPKANLPPKDLEQLTKDALLASRISFAPPSAEKKYYGICYPGQPGVVPIVANGAEYEGGYKNLIWIKPMKIVKRCSGNGLGSQDENGNVQLEAILVRYPDDDDTARANPFSSIGETEFWLGVGRAFESVKQQ